MVSVDVSLVSPTASSLQPQLRNSHSNLELFSSSKEAVEDMETPRLPLPDYYNIFVPNLPAHSPRQSTASTGLVSHFTEAPSTHKSTVHPHSECPKLATGESEYTDSGYPEVTCPTKHGVVDISNNGYAKFKREDRRQMVDSPSSQSGYSSLHDMQQMVQELNENEKLLEKKVNGKVTIRSSPISNYDHLEIHTPSRSPCYSPVPAPESRESSPRPNCYDTLAPIQNGVGTQTFVVEEQHYDSLSPRTYVQRSKSSSPELTKSSVPMNRYERKVALLGHSHSYEDIHIEKVKQGGNDRSTGESPTNMQHPLEWARGSQNSSKVLENGPRHGETLPDIPRVSRNSPNTQSRRKQLPLQEVDENTTMDGIDSIDGVSPALPTKTSRTRNGFPIGTTKPPQKPSHKVRLVSQQSSTSETSEFLSSTEGSRDSTVSNESTFSAEMERSQPLQTLGNETRSRTPSPFRRDTHEFVNLRPRIQSVKVETIAVDSSKPNLPPKKSIATSSSDSDSSEFSPTCTKPEEETSQSPPIPPRNYLSSPSHSHVAEKVPPVPPKQTGSNERAPPLPQRSPEQTSLTFTLPQKEIVFEKPPVPPRPRLLNQSDTDGEIRTIYTTVEIKPQEDTSCTYSSVPCPRLVKSMKNVVSRLESDRGAYTSIDFDTTHQLHKMMEERKEMKRS